ncbi:electron transfer flavoprotein subunit alpha/FixB family protein [Jeongeupia sp. USM3]|uniref:electron transfer flavoprotein subunit alpha/FixB family protein n=1 Tax=Jeongeupia sp. USM3 TaxID=1906741 RepID=UPI001F484048|nr:FAD-binding protein [Jeongeupia sp. USM3]
MVERGALGGHNPVKATAPPPFAPAARALVVGLNAQDGELPGLVAAAARLAGHVDVLDDGLRPDGLLAGAARRLCCAAPAPSIDALADWIAALARDYDCVIAAADSGGKDWLPRAAALDGAQAFSDVIGIAGADTLLRAIYAGDLIETVRNRQPRLWMTVRATAFRAIAGAHPLRIDQAGPATGASRVRVLGRQAQGGETLKDARALVAGGRPLGSAERFAAVLGPLAERLRGTLAASRAAVDAGYAPNSWQVGQTGQIVAPGVYVAAGISGAAQHVAGMRDSGLIVAINTDPDAPMMKLADIAWQADLFDAVPALCAALDARGVTIAGAAPDYSRCGPA